MCCDCCCCCCCREEPPPQNRVSPMAHRDDVIVSPIFGPITTQPPATAFTITQSPAVDYVTMQPTAFTTITTHTQVFTNTTSSATRIIGDNRLPTHQQVATAGPLHGPGANMAATAPLPTAPPAPSATDHYWTKTKLAHTEPSVMLGDGLYVGRVVAGRDTLPAILETSRVVDRRSGVMLEQFVVANFFYKEQAGCTEDFEVLSCSKTSWRSAMGGYVVPENAIVCGRTAAGRPLYLGRALDEGTYHYGTADPEDGLLYSMARAGTWYGCVRTSQHFDILVAA